MSYALWYHDILEIETLIFFQSSVTCDSTISPHLPFGVWWDCRITGDATLTENRCINSYSNNTWFMFVQGSVGLSSHLCRRVRCIKVLTIGRCGNGSNFGVITKHMLRSKFRSTSCEIAMKCVSANTFVQLMPWWTHGFVHIYKQAHISTFYLLVLSLQ